MLNKRDLKKLKGIYKQCLDVMTVRWDLNNKMRDPKKAARDRVIAKLSSIK